MIHTAERTILREQLAQLVAGESTNVEFEDASCTHQWQASNDRGVAAISEFGCAICDRDDFALTFRLTGKHAVAEETRRAAERCDLFLQSSREYEWPDFPTQDAEGCLAGMAIFWGIPFAIALGIIASLMVLQRDWSIAWQTAATAVFTGSAAAAAIWWWSKCANRENRTFEKAGDHDVWPFFRRDDCAVTTGRTVSDSAPGSR